MNYAKFIDAKSQLTRDSGFKPKKLTDKLFPFQKHIVETACRHGRSALFADCGLGKSICELSWGEQVVRKTNKPVLLLTPIAVGAQMIREAEKFGIEAKRSRHGESDKSKCIWVTNYEQLQKFNPSDFSGIICDESSILKSLGGTTQKQITRFASKLQYRLMATATPSPNDYVELGTTSEAIGELNNSEMLKRFFRQLDDKGQKQATKQQEEAEKLIAQDPNYFKKLAYRVSQTIGQWRLKNHAVKDFWRWVASWSQACRKPSDLGFSDDGFILPPLNEVDHIVIPDTPPPGFLFNMPAVGLRGEREERTRTLQTRCEFVANLVAHDKPAVVWCHSNAEGDLLEELIPDAKQVSGRTPDDEKIEIYEAFSGLTQRVVIIKPKIGAWGLNWQHCNHVVTFASHSYEQHYQAVRRCWRFGQANPVRVDVIATEGEERVLQNMRKKAEKAELMFTALVAAMHDSERIDYANNYQKKVTVPSWL